MGKTKIVFLMLPHLHLLDLAGPAQVFLEAQEHGVDISLEYCSFDSSIECSCHIGMRPLKHFSKVKLGPGDFLIVPGASVDYLLSRELKAQHDLFAWVNAVYAQGATVASVCTGAFFLAQSGLLDGRACTTHWKRAEQLKNNYPKIKLVEDILFTKDDRILTSAGVTAGIDLALHIVSQLKDEMTSYKVARELVVYLRRNGIDSQQSIYMKYRNHIHSGIHKVQDYVHENLHQGASLPALSEVACMSTRNLTRTFKREAGITINSYINLVRQERLRELSKNPDFTRKQLARFCGLKSERQVIRLMGQLA